MGGLRCYTSRRPMHSPAHRSYEHLSAERGCLLVLGVECTYTRVELVVLGVECTYTRVELDCD